MIIIICWFVSVIIMFCWDSIFYQLIFLFCEVIYFSKRAYIIGRWNSICSCGCLIIIIFISVWLTVLEVGEVLLQLSEQTMCSNSFYFGETSKRVVHFKGLLGFHFKQWKLYFINLLFFILFLLIYSFFSEGRCIIYLKKMMQKNTVLHPEQVEIATSICHTYSTTIWHYFSS